MRIAWELSQTVLVQTSLEKAWAYHINIEENWKEIEGDSVEYIKLDGPYATGTKGQTKMKAQAPTDWALIEVIPFTKSVTEVRLPDARIQFEFTFLSLSDHQLSLTQKVSLLGEGADPYIEMMQQSFGQSLEAGMKKIAEQMEKWKD